MVAALGQLIGKLKKSAITIGYYILAHVIALEQKQYAQRVFQGCISGN